CWVATPGTTVPLGGPWAGRSKVARCPPEAESYTGSWSAGPTGGRGLLSRRLKPASRRLTMRSLSQAPLLGRLCRPHGSLSGAALSPLVPIRQQLRPKDSLLPVKEAEVRALRGPFPHSSTMLRDAPVNVGCLVSAAQRRRVVGAVVQLVGVQLSGHRP